MKFKDFKLNFSNFYECKIDEKLTSLSILKKNIVGKVHKLQCEKAFCLTLKCRALSDNFLKQKSSKFQLKLTWEIRSKAVHSASLWKLIKALLWTFKFFIDNFKSFHSLKLSRETSKSYF